MHRYYIHPPPLPRSAYPLQPHTGPLPIGCHFRLPPPIQPIQQVYTLYIMSLTFFIHLPMKMEPIRSSETSAIKTQTPGNYPKRNILQLEFSFVSAYRTFCPVLTSTCLFLQLSAYPTSHMTLSHFPSLCYPTDLLYPLPDASDLPHSETSIPTFQRIVLDLLTK